VVPEICLPALGRKTVHAVSALDRGVHESIVEYSDYHRFGTIAMALRRIDGENIPGALAEAGVFEGHASRFIHRLAPERRYYLFDTFEGFDKDDLDPEVSKDNRFRNTSVEAVLHFIGDQRNLVVKKRTCTGDLCRSGI